MQLHRLGSEQFSMGGGGWGGPWRRGLMQEGGGGDGRGLVLRGHHEQFYETNNRKERGWGWGREREPREQVEGRLG